MESIVEYRERLESLAADPSQAAFDNDSAYWVRKLVREVQGGPWAPPERAEASNLVDEATLLIARIESGRLAA
jgi:hypothetical protein